ncbi:reductase [Lithospermum erythrorhizon]|uniref:Reductase n=1 Tax=Lithospermum erythrorhizon TaxID=34254 RepID=A0AAV3PUA5_LITER
MTSSHSIFSPPPSTLLNLHSSKSKTICLFSQNPFSTTSLKTTPFFITKSSTSDSLSNTTTVDKPISSNTSTNSTNDELGGARIGAKIRVKVPLKVYHIPKVPEFDLDGKIGTMKQFVGFHKGKTISANLPFKVEFKEDGIEGRDGPVKFFAHLKEDEFEYVD